MDKISHERVQAFKKMYDEASQIYINNGGFLRNVGADASPIMQVSNPIFDFFYKNFQIKCNKTSRFFYRTLEK